MTKKNPELEKALFRYFSDGKTIDQTERELKELGKPVPRSTIGYHAAKFRSGYIPDVQTNGLIDVSHAIGIALGRKAIVAAISKIRADDFSGAKMVAEAYGALGQLLLKYHNDLVTSETDDLATSILAEFLQYLRIGKFNPEGIKMLENIEIENTKRVILRKGDRTRGRGKSGNTLSDLIDRQELRVRMEEEEDRERQRG